MPYFPWVWSCAGTIDFIFSYHFCIKYGLALTNLNSKSMTELSGIILSKLDLWWDSNQLEAFALVRMHAHG